MTSPAINEPAPRRSAAPGVALAAGLAVIAIAISALLPATIPPVLVAVLLGLAAGNTFVLPAAAEPGLAFTGQRILRWGVALLGAELLLTDIASIGVVSLGAVLATMAIAFATVSIAARLWRVPPALAVLLAVGTAVCGNSAIVATAPVIDADEAEIGAALATITIFGTLALLLFPALGHLSGLTDEVFGFWAGLSINDTSQVVAAGASYSPTALEVATVVKLVRNTLMAPLILILYWWMRRRGPRRSIERSSAVGATRRAFPLFVLVFVLLAALRSAGAIGDELASGIATLSTLLIVLAITAVGLSTKLADLKQVGMRPFAVGLSAATVLALVGFGLAQALVG